jgi:hypothetical protein
MSEADNIRRSQNTHKNMRSLATMISTLEKNVLSSEMITVSSLIQMVTKSNVNEKILLALRALKRYYICHNTKHNAAGVLPEFCHLPAATSNLTQTLIASATTLASCH